jgi:imidazolonepropionase-like amidohydrolase
MTSTPTALALTGGRVFSAVDGDVVHADVVVRDGRIDAITTGPPRGATVLDVSGCTVLPGLIDSHVHLAANGSPDIVAQMGGDSVPVATLRAAQAAAAHLAAGTTTVRDLGARDGVVVEFARARDEGLATGARVIAAGWPITMTGGHAHFIGREADGPDALRHATRLTIKEGAQVVKVIASGGLLTKGVGADQITYSLDELRAVTDEAHHAGLRVAAHAIGLPGIKDALRAGVDSIEHGFYLDDEAIDLMLAHGTYLVPTLSGVHAVLTGRVPSIAPWLHAKSVAVEADRRASFAKAAAAGVRFAAGTDAGTPGNYHGHVAEEVELLAGCGLTAEQAIIAATRHGAENLGIADESGTVAVGKRADLLVVDGDPLRDLAALHRVRYVLQDGIVVADSAPDADDTR